MENNFEKDDNQNKNSINLKEFLAINKFRFIRIIFFIFFLILILLILSYIFMPKNNTNEAGMDEYGIHQILGEKENSIDLIVLGNSIAYTSFVPMELWRNYGYTTYICGNPGQILPDSIKELYEIMKKQSPKIVVLEANAIFDDDVSLTVPLARIIQTIFPITEYHDRWKKLKLNDFYDSIEYSSTDVFKGYHYKRDIVPVDRDVSNYMNVTDEVTNISKRAKTYVKIINEFCKKNNSKLILISVPNVKSWNYSKYNGTMKFAKEENIEFIDLNTISKEIKIDWNNDTLDGGDHMNYSGSLKITDYFGIYLQTLEILENHKDNPNYDEWNNDLIEYDKIVGNSI